MKNLFSIFVFLLFNYSFSQTPLHFVELGSDPAYCRTAGYQSGNGVVWAAVGGGVPDYSYLWVDLQSGDTLTWNSINGGMNPGLYQITVTDNVGTTLVDTVAVDSVNPIAVIVPDPDDVFFALGYHMAYAPATIDLYNQSLHTGYDLPGPWPATMTYSWKLGNYGSWVEETGDWNSSNSQVTFEYGGFQGVCLAIENKNECRDTSCFYFIISGPLEIDEKEITFSFNPSNQNLVINSMVGFEFDLRIFNMNGQLVLHSNLESGQVLPVSLENGTYIYELLDPQTGQQIKSGKFLY